MTVAWLSFFPVEWLPDAPAAVRNLPRLHPSTWQRVLLEELEKEPSIRLHILVLRKQFAANQSFTRNGVVFHLIKTRGGMRAPSLFWHDTLLVKRALKTIRPDLLHAWGTEEGAALVASRLHYPYLVTIQGLMSWMSELFPLTIRERLAARLESVSLARAGVVTAESNFSAGFIRRKYPHLTVRHVDVTPARLFHRVERRPQTDPFRLVFVAGLGPRKGGDLLISALDRLKDEIPFELLVIGGAEPAFLGKMKSITSAAVWERVQFKNNLEPAQIAEELGRAALMVCPTRADTGPMAVKEAVVAGVPVVGSNVGGVPDYVIPGKNGLLFETGNLEACIQAIRSAWHHPLFGKGLVDANTLAELRQQLSVERMGRSFFETYRAINGPKEVP
ncbi:MAG: hypothetical protein QOF48_2563 [Verrucomicrobiota bacterium]|jgi:glycosyltransferase involved in cell wall biosynthesis